jgi:hypothetical protein
MRHHYFEFRVIPREHVRLSGTRSALAGVLAPHRLGDVEKDEHPSLVTRGREPPRLVYIVHREILAVGQNLADPYRPQTGAPLYLGGSAWGERRNYRERFQLSARFSRRVDRIVVAQFAQPEVFESETENPAFVHAVLFHGRQNVVCRAPSVSASARQIREITLASGYLFPVRNNFPRINVHMSIYYHTHSIT